MNIHTQTQHDTLTHAARLRGGAAIDHARMAGSHDEMTTQGTDREYHERRAAIREGRACGALYQALERAYDAGQLAGRSRGGR